MYAGSERRQFPRIRVSFIVVYRVNQPLEISMLVGNTEVHAIMSDLSEDGMAVLTNYNIPAPSLITAKFIVLNERALRATERIRMVEVSGEVRYALFLKERAYKLGVHFREIDEPDRAFIRDFIRWTPVA